MFWSRYGLSRKGFLYDPTLIEAGELPPHVERLRESILDFSCLVPTETGATGLECIETSLADPDVRARLKNPEINAAENIREEAERLHEGGFSEDHWVEFFLKMFFDRLGSDINSSRQEPRMSSRAHFHYDAFVRERDGLWGVFTEKDTIFTLESSPKPDLAFYLPIFDTRAASTHGTVAFSDQKWKQRPISSLVEPFTWTTLNKLSAYGLHPGPRPISDKSTDKRTETTNSAQLRCWPWLIVELKKRHKIDAAANRANEVVCCQAANAAGCALQLQRQLARYSIPLPDEGHVAPVPTMTIEGSRITVWIAYYAKDVCRSTRFGIVSSQSLTYDEAFIMQAVWEGDMTKLGDIMRFRMALENIYTWACRWFRPHVATYLDQWKFVHLREVGSSNTEEVSERREKFRKAVPMVDALLNEYKALPVDFPDYGDKVNPLALSLILQQMAMLSHESLLKGVEEKIKTEIDRVLAAMYSPKQSPQADGGTEGSNEGAEPQSADRDGFDNISQEGSDNYSPESAVRASTEATPASQTAHHLPNLPRSTRSNAQYWQGPIHPRSRSVEVTAYEDESSELSLPRSRSETPTGITETKAETSAASASSPPTSTSSFGERTPSPFSFPPATFEVSGSSMDINTKETSDRSNPQPVSVSADASTATGHDGDDEVAKQSESDIPAFDTEKILWKATVHSPWDTSGHLWHGYKYHEHLVGESFSVVCVVEKNFWLALDNEGNLGWIWSGMASKVPDAYASGLAPGLAE